MFTSTVRNITQLGKELLKNSKISHETTLPHHFFVYVTQGHATSLLFSMGSVFLA
jgi:hypothetical protein